MRQFISILMAGLLVACTGDSTNPPELPSNQLRVVNGPATCDACSVVELTVAGPGLDKVSDASLTHHATLAAVAASVEIRHFVGDSGLVLEIKVTFTEAVPAGDYDLHLQEFGAGGEERTLRIPVAIKVTSPGPGPGPGTPPPPLPPPPGPTGVLRVSASTSGEHPFAPYLVTVDPCDPDYSCAGQSVPAGGTVAIALSPGNYRIGLANVPVACTVAEPRSVAVAVIAGQYVNVSFSVSCPAPPPPGTARVTASVTGPDPDMSFLLAVGTCDYYSYYSCSTYQLQAGVAIDVALAARSYAMQLVGVADNCTVAAPHPRTVTLVSGATTEVVFTVTCLAAGTIRVTAPTTGPDSDQGYLVSLGGCAAGPCAELWMDAGGSVEFTRIPGSYTIELKDVASNCAVSGPNPATVTITAGTTTIVAFSVTCTALPPPPPPGTVRVTAPTSGTNRDTDYYSTNESACNYYYGCMQEALPASGSVEYTLGAGSYQFRLTGVAANCTVSSPNPATVTVVSGMTTELVFPVSCR